MNRLARSSDSSVALPPPCSVSASQRGPFKPVEYRRPRKERLDVGRLVAQDLFH
jgi:hypothetical protein